MKKVNTQTKAAAAKFKTNLKAGPKPVLPQGISFDNE